MSADKYLSAVLANAPKRGNGLDLWIFAAACGLRRCKTQRFTDGEMIDLIRTATEGCGVRRGEIERAVVRSAAEVGEQVSGTLDSKPAFAIANKPLWPAVDSRLRSDVISASEMTMADLWCASPVWFQDGEPQTAAILATLFPGNPLLCCGKSNRSFGTAPLSEWAEIEMLDQLALIVPSAMSALRGETQDGKLSAHSLANTGPRQYLVIEADPQKWADLSDADRELWGEPDRYLQRRKDEQAAILWHLGTHHGPLTMVVDSGGKSLQGWFACHGMTDEQLRPFMQYAVSLGADRATWTRSQFVRMPDGLRDNGTRQSIIYFSPEAAR